MAEDLSDQLTFKAWTERKDTGEGLKLHVHGEIHVSDESLIYQLDKKDQQGYFPDELFLEIKPEPIKGNTKLEIKYHEDLPGETLYKKITIFAKSVQVYEINEIGQR